MLFSVVIPVYNKEKEIRSTLETVLVQSFTDFEVVLVDDGSSDGSMEVVKGIKDSRIRLLSQKTRECPLPAMQVSDRRLDNTSPCWMRMTGGSLLI